jgi:hypothetical protein
MTFGTETAQIGNLLQASEGARKLTQPSWIVRPPS